LEKEPSLRYQRVSELKSDVDTYSDSIVRRPAAVPVHAASYTAEPMPPVKQPAARPSLPGPIPGEFFAAVAHPQTYRNLLYLLLSFPLGLIYFVFLVVGLALGVGTLIIWVGAFVLLGTFLGVKVLTGLERKLASGLLQTTIPSRVVSTPVYRNPDRTVFEKARDLMISRESWAGIGYLLVKFPLGIISLVLTFALLTLSLSLLASPVLAVVQPQNLNVGAWKIDTPYEAAPFALVGVVVMFLSLHILNGLAWLHACWAKLCLKRLPAN